MPWNILGLGLICWRLTSLLVREDGPYDMFAKFRKLTGLKYDELSRPVGTNVISSALTCVWCSSIWVGGALSFLFVKREKFHKKIGIALILSSIAILFDRLIDHLEN